MYSIKISEKTLKFGNVIVNKIQFHASKKPIALNFVDVDKMVISDKFKHNDQGFRYFISYKDDNIIRPLCVVLPQMSGFMKCFHDGGKNISFLVEDYIVLIKYNEIWNKIKKILNIKFHSKPK